MLGSEHSEEEWSLFGSLDRLIFNVWYDDVVYILLVVGGLQPNSACDFTLFESLETLGSLKHNVLAVNLPQSVSLRLYTDENEVDRNVRLLGDVDVLLHKTNDHLCLLVDSKPILRVVEPLFISVKLSVCLLSFFSVICKCGWVWTSVSNAFPFSLDGELTPVLWENLADIHLVVVNFPVGVSHPPVTIVSESVTEYILETSEIIPRLVFVAELSSPFSLSSSPRVTDIKQLKLLLHCNVFHSEDTVGVVV